MKKAFKLFGIIVLVAVIGFSMAACGGEDPNGNGDGNGDGDGNGNGNGSGTQKSITITGLIGITKSGSVYIAPYIAPNSTAGSVTPVAGGKGTVSDNTLAVSLYTWSASSLTTTPWTGSGSHYIMLAVFDSSDSSTTTSYFYTEGKTRTELGITSLDGLPKYNINSASSTIDFSQFKSITHLNSGSD